MPFAEKALWYCYNCLDLTWEKFFQVWFTCFLVWGQRPRICDLFDKHLVNCKMLGNSNTTSQRIRPYCVFSSLAIFPPFWWSQSRTNEEKADLQQKIPSGEKLGLIPSFLWDNLTRMKTTLLFLYSRERRWREELHINTYIL